MSPYYNELPTTGMDEEAMIVLVVMLVFLGIVLLCCLVGWILSCVGLHKVAKRRGIRNAWLAWIPIGSEWVLGSVSDQYQHLVCGKVTSRRKLLPILSLVMVVFGISYLAAGFVTGMVADYDSSPFGILLAVLIPYLLTIGAGITLAVFYHISNYDFYRSCKPDSAVVFLVLSIVLPVCQPFFYFACRNRDQGMIIPESAAPAAPAEPAELPPVDPGF